MPVGPLELVLLAVILIGLFGVSRLPSVGRQLGKGAREAKKGVGEVRQAIGLTPEPAAEAETPEADAKTKLPPLTPKAAIKRLLD